MRKFKLDFYDHCEYNGITWDVSKVDIQFQIINQSRRMKTCKFLKFLRVDILVCLFRNVISDDREKNQAEVIILTARWRGFLLLQQLCTLSLRSRAAALDEECVSTYFLAISKRWVFVVFRIWRCTGSNSNSWNLEGYRLCLKTNTSVSDDASSIKYLRLISRVSVVRILNLGLGDKL